MSWDGKIRINDPASTKSYRLNGDPKTFKNEAVYYWVIDARKHNIPSKPSDKKEETTMPVYVHLQDVPASYKPAIKKLMEKKALVGYKDPDPKRLDDNIINVSEDFCRVMSVLNNMGKLD